MICASLMLLKWSLINGQPAPHYKWNWSIIDALCIERFIPLVVIITVWFSSSCSHEMIRLKCCQVSWKAHTQNPVLSHKPCFPPVPGKWTHTLRKNINKNHRWSLAPWPPHILSNKIYSSVCVSKPTETRKVSFLLQSDLEALNCLINMKTATFFCATFSSVRFLILIIVSCSVSTSVHSP